MCKPLGWFLGNMSREQRGSRHQEASHVLFEVCTKKAGFVAAIYSSVCLCVCARAHVVARQECNAWFQGVV